MGEDLSTTRDDLAILPTKSIIEVAQEAERRIDAIIKIKQIALKVTNSGDWTDQQGKPYLQGSGAEKVANLFNISWRIDEPRIEFEDDGHFTYTYKGDFSLAGRSIQVDGSRSSKDPFFKKYNYDKDEQGKTIKTEKPLSAIDKRDVKMAAMTNLLGNGVTRILGIRNLTWDDLLKYAGIKQSEVAGVHYGKEGEKPPLKEPQKKANGEAPIPGPDLSKKITEPQSKRFYAIAKGAGKTEANIKAYLYAKIGSEHSSDIPQNLYDEICLWAKEREPGAEG